MSFYKTECSYTPLANKVSLDRAACDVKRRGLEIISRYLFDKLDNRSRREVKSATENIPRVSIICYLNVYLC